MCSKINLDEINKIPKDEFKDILHSWMDEKHIVKNFQIKFRKQLFHQFSKTEVGHAMELENQKKSFNPKRYIINAIEAEHLYAQKFFFSLSVFSAEADKIPNFEREEGTFRFENKDIQDYLEILGLNKNDSIVKQIAKAYNSSQEESLLSILLKKLILNHRAIENKASGTQTDVKKEKENENIVDLSQVSYRSKSTRKHRKKSLSLASYDQKSRKPKRSGGVTLIAQNLDKMSQNISIITNKLEDFKKSSSHDDSKAVISYVGSIMQQLNICVNNFEQLCCDIKAINEGKTKTYDDYLNELKNSDNGRKFLKKFSKSFSRILDEEKIKIQKECHRKLEKEKRKLSKLYHTSIKAKTIAKAPENENDYSKEVPDTQVAKDIDKIYRDAFSTIRNIEKENEIFEKVVEMEIMSKKKNEEVYKTTKSTVPANVNLDLNECRQIHSSKSSSIKSNPHSYSSSSFEDDISDINI